MIRPPAYIDANTVWWMSYRWKRISVGNTHPFRNLVHEPLCIELFLS